MPGPVTIDFETRSTADLKEGGAFRYAEDPGTEVMCLAVKPYGETPRVWLPAERLTGDARGALGLVHLEPLTDDELRGLVDGADVIEAHNAMFDWLIWREKMVPRGFAAIPVSKLRDTAARAAAAGLPRDLEGACIALGTKEEKDTEGAKLMRKLCKPRKPLKSELKKNPELAGRVLWHEDPNDIARLCLYCCQDVTAQEDLSRSMPAMTAGELAVWRLDFAINVRGVRADLESAVAVMRLTDAYASAMKAEFRELTGLDSPSQREATLRLLQGMGVPVGGLTAGEVSEALGNDSAMFGDGLDSEDGKARRVLEIRQSLSKSSNAKYKAIRNVACRDGRLHGLFMYYGAATGRWAGRLVQPQNFPRGVFGDADGCLQLFREGDVELIEALYADIPVAASTCLRGILCAAPGHDFVCADYSAIEGRTLAWLAGEETALDVYRRGGDPYKVAASGIFGKPVEDISKAERQTGKVAELACGYQGGVVAFQAMARNYSLDIDDDKARAAVDGWRAGRPKTVAWWRQLENAARRAIDCPGSSCAAGKVSFTVADGCLIARLPSGRCLRYRNPRFELKSVPWGEGVKECLCYDGVNSTTHQWGPIFLYGGKLAENITQATARDVLCNGMLACERAGYRIVMHVHDEAISEVPEGFGSVEEFERTLCTLPEWGRGLPLKAEGWRGKRYRK